MTRLAYDKRRAAQMLCLSEREFSDMVRKGILPAPRVVGTKELWPHDELRALLSQDKTPDEIRW